MNGAFPPWVSTMGQLRGGMVSKHVLRRQNSIRKSSDRIRSFVWISNSMRSLRSRLLRKQTEDRLELQIARSCFERQQLRKNAKCPLGICGAVDRHAIDAQVK